MDILNGSFLKLVISLKVIKFGLIFWICLNIIVCINVGWKLWYIQQKNLKKKILVGIEEEIIYNIMKMDIVKVLMSLNLFIL